MAEIKIWKQIARGKVGRSVGKFGKKFRPLFFYVYLLEIVWQILLKRWMCPSQYLFDPVPLIEATYECRV